jgi:hypothetical protein
MLRLVAAVAVAMFMAFISAASIMPVTMFVIFAVPVPLVVTPAIRVSVVVRVAPISSWIGRFFVAAGNPAIMMSLRRPEAADPYHHGRGRWWWRRFIGNRRRTNCNGDRNLTRCRQDQRHCEKQTASASDFHLYLQLCAPCPDPSESGEAYLAVSTRSATLLKSRERSNAAQVGYAQAVMHDGRFCTVVDE